MSTALAREPRHGPCMPIPTTSSDPGSTRDVYFNDLTVVPEPASATLGLIGTVLLLRRRR